MCGPNLELNLRLALEKAPQTRKFLEEDLPRVSISCQAGIEPGYALESRGLPNPGLADVHFSPGLHTSRPQVQPQQKGLADGRWQSWLQQVASFLQV